MMDPILSSEVDRKTKPHKSDYQKQKSSCDRDLLFLTHGNVNVRSVLSHLSPESQILLGEVAPVLSEYDFDFQDILDLIESCDYDRDKVCQEIALVCQEKQGHQLGGWQVATRHKSKSKSEVSLTGPGRSKPNMSINRRKREGPKKKFGASSRISRPYKQSPVAQLNTPSEAEKEEPQCHQTGVDQASESPSQRKQLEDALSSAAKEAVSEAKVGQEISSSPTVCLSSSLQNNDETPTVPLGVPTTEAKPETKETLASPEETLVRKSVVDITPPAKTRQAPKLQTSNDHGITSMETEANGVSSTSDNASFLTDISSRVHISNPVAPSQPFSSSCLMPGEAHGARKDPEAIFMGETCAVFDDNDVVLPTQLKLLTPTEDVLFDHQIIKPELASAGMTFGDLKFSKPSMPVFFFYCEDQPHLPNGSNESPKLPSSGAGVSAPPPPGPCHLFPGSIPPPGLIIEGRHGLGSTSAEARTAPPPPNLVREEEAALHQPGQTYESMPFRPQEPLYSKSSKGDETSDLYFPPPDQAHRSELRKASRSLEPLQSFSVPSPLQRLGGQPSPDVAHDQGTTQQHYLGRSVKRADCAPLPAHSQPFQETLARKEEFPRESPKRGEGDHFSSRHMNPAMETLKPKRREDYGFYDHQPQETTMLSNSQSTRAEAPLHSHHGLVRQMHGLEKTQDPRRGQPLEWSGKDASHCEIETGEIRYAGPAAVQIGVSAAYDAVSGFQPIAPRSHDTSDAASVLKLINNETETSKGLRTKKVTKPGARTFDGRQKNEYPQQPEAIANAAFSSFIKESVAAETRNQFDPPQRHAVHDENYLYQSGYERPGVSSPTTQRTSNVSVHVPEQYNYKNPNAFPHSIAHLSHGHPTLTTQKLTSPTTTPSGPHPPRSFPSSTAAYGVQAPGDISNLMHARQGRQQPAMSHYATSHVPPQCARRSVFYYENSGANPSGPASMQPVTDHRTSPRTSSNYAPAIGELRGYSYEASTQDYNMIMQQNAAYHRQVHSQVSQASSAAVYGAPRSIFAGNYYAGSSYPPGGSTNPLAQAPLSQPYF